MKAQAVRLHGKNDLRLEEVELPSIEEDEILVEIVSDSICMSTYKTVLQGAAHKRVHEDVAEHPAIVGHELAGNILEVGTKYRGVYVPGMRFTIQPALKYKGTAWGPGYSYEYCGGDTTYCILPHEVMDCNCLLEYTGDAYYKASLAEPMSCNIGAFHSAYHTTPGVYRHDMGIKEGGKLALVGAAGPMGLGGLAYALNCDRRPSLVVLADIAEDRLARAEKLFPPEKILREKGIELHFVNTGEVDDPIRALRDFTGGAGYDDVFCYAPVSSVVTMSSSILGFDGCLSFFAGPTDKNFSAELNYYDVHYNSTHLFGTSGGNTDDMVEFLDLASRGEIDPSFMVTHIGGLGAVVETTCNLPKIPGGKKLIYTHTDLPLIALADLRDMEPEDARFGELADIVDDHDGLWSPEAERYLLANWADK